MHCRVIFVALLLAATACAAKCTSNSSGLWQNASIWTCGAVPGASDNVTIASGHTVLGNGTTNVAANLTVNSGGTFNATSGITNITSATNVSGTFNAGSATLYMGSGYPGNTVQTFALQVNNGAVFNGGTGNHTYGCLYTFGGSSFTATSAITTLNSQTLASTTLNLIANTFNHSNGTMVFAAGFSYWRTYGNHLYNFVQTGGYAFEHNSAAMYVDNNFSVSGATFSFIQDTSIVFVVNGSTMIGSSGLLETSSETLTFNGPVTVASGGTFGQNTPYTLNVNAQFRNFGTFYAPNVSGTWKQNGTFVNYGAFYHDSGTARFTGNAYIIGVNSTRPFNRLIVDAGKNVTHMYDSLASSSEVVVNGRLDTLRNALNLMDGRVSTGISTAFTDFTVEIWFKDDMSTGYDFERLADKSYTGCFWFGRNSNNANSWGGGVLETVGPYGVFIPLTDGQWHQIVSIRNSTNHSVIGDGGIASASNTVSNSACDATEFLIGDGTTGQKYRGIIGEVRLYSRALSPQEVSDHYRNVYSNESGLAGKWRFNEGQGSSTLNEATGSSNSVTGHAWLLSNVSLGGLMINTTGIFNATSGILNITNGNLVNYGSLYSNNGTVQFTGNGYIIGATASNQLANLVVWAGKNVTTLPGSLYAINGTTVNGLLDAKQDSLWFDDTNDYVSVPDTNAVSLTGQTATIEAWIKPASLGMDAFVHKEAEYTFALMNGGLTYADSSNWCYSCTGSFGAILTNTWQHVAVTTNSSGYTFYINGQKVGSYATSTWMFDNANPLCLGAYSCSTNWYNGELDEVRIYNRSLSPAEIYEHYHNTYSNETGLSGKWSFNEGAGTTAYDTSGYGSTGYLNNGPLWRSPNVTTGWLTINSGGTYNATDGFTTTTWRDPNQYALYNAGAFYHNNGTFVVASPHALFNMGGTGPGKNLYNLNISQYGFFYAYSDLKVENDLAIGGGGQVISGAWQYRKLNVTGNVLVSAPSALGPTDPVNLPYNFGNCSFGSLRVEPGATYWAPAGTVNITNGNFINYGTFLDNETNTIRFTNNGFIIGTNASNPLNLVTIDAGKNVSHLADGFYSVNDTTVNGRLESRQAALSFDSTSSYVDLGTSATTAPTSAVSIEVWFKPTSDGTLNYIVNNDHSNGYGYTLTEVSGLLYYGVENGTDISDKIYTCSECANKWTFATLTYNGSNVSFYVNGKYVASHPVTGSIAYTDRRLTIGSYSYFNDQFNGQISRVRLYNRAITASEVWDHFHNVYSNENGLIGRWDLNEGAGTAAYDSSSSGITGTIFNATWVVPNVRAAYLGINSGGTYSATKGNTTLTRGYYSGYIFYNYGTFIHNNGTIVVNSTVNSNNFKTNDNSFYNVIIERSPAFMLSSYDTKVNITGNLTIGANAPSVWACYDQSVNFSVAGTAAVASGGELDARCVVRSLRTDNNFGTLNVSGTFTSGNSTLTASSLVVNSGGTATFDNVTELLQGISATGNFYRFLNYPIRVINGSGSPVAGCSMSINDSYNGNYITGTNNANGYWYPRIFRSQMNVSGTRTVLDNVSVSNAGLVNSIWMNTSRGNHTIVLGASQGYSLVGSVLSSGFTPNVTVGGSPLLGPYTGMQPVEIRNGSQVIASFQHDFSTGDLDLNTLTAKAGSYWVGFSGKLPATLYVPLRGTYCNVHVCTGITNISDTCAAGWDEWNSEPQGWFCLATINGTVAEEQVDPAVTRLVAAPLPWQAVAILFVVATAAWSLGSRRKHRH